MNISASMLQMTLGGAPILNGIDFTAKAGEFVGIIGPNGSGKSTLLRCIYRILSPSGGAVYLGDKDISTYSYKESAKRVAVVAQHNYYNFDFTVQEVVLMGRAPHKRTLDTDTAQDYEIVRQALKTVDMERFGSRSFSTLSGGEQQRILLARALAQQTPCIVLDEPTNHLDIKYQLQLMDIVKGLDTTVVSAVHDLNIAAKYCDKIYVVKEGCIVAAGTPSAVLTKEMMRAVYEVDAEIYKDDTGQMHILYHAHIEKKGA